MSKTIELHPETIAQIESAPIPQVIHAQMRQRTRKEWAGEVRELLKRLGIKNVSVTTPSYSMAQSIDISTPRFFAWDGDHEQRHKEIDEQERNSASWMGYGHFCEFCKQEWQAKKKLESIILAAFPDLNDRSDTQSDHFDYCLSIN
jgi:hypothetical protein